MKKYFIGIDIQSHRNCSYGVIDISGKLVYSGWFSDLKKEAVELINDLKGTHQIEVGIDAPRMPLPAKRDWYWSGAKNRWDRRKNQKGHGRHCEVVVSAHRLANPQWTPLLKDAPKWIALGFDLFSALDGFVKTHEVFPTASYSLLRGKKEVRIDADFSECSRGPKDMLDAWVAAVTIREFSVGQGAEVGGGDGLGTIILPRPLPEKNISNVLQWPG